MESQTISTDAGISTNLRTEVPYYLRGYEMIEKEIELIVNRRDVELFNESLLELEKIKNNLNQNKDFERLQAIFDNTPINSPNDFFAAKIMYEEIKQEITSKNISYKKNIFLAVILGIVFSIFYVAIVIGIKRRSK